jgi:hypothetical protein
MEKKRQPQREKQSESLLPAAGDRKRQVLKKEEGHGRGGAGRGDRETERQRDRETRLRRRRLKGYVMLLTTSDLIPLTDCCVMQATPSASSLLIGCSDYWDSHIQ